jgi:hypothetical protein
MAAAAAANASGVPAAAALAGDFKKYKFWSELNQAENLCVQDFLLFVRSFHFTQVLEIDSVPINWQFNRI